MCRSALLLGGVLATASACGSAPTREPKAALTTVATGDAETILGSVDGLPIRRRDLDASAEDELKKIDNEAKQRAFHVLWLAVDAAVAKKLIERYAARRHLSVADLRQEEIDANVVPPSDEEVERLYQANKEMIRVPLEMARPFLKQQMLEERRSQQVNALVKRLRANADVRITVPLPILPRFDVEVGDSPQLGPRDAAVTLIEFSDFECPYCARVRETLHELREIYPDSLRLVFRDFPLEQHSRAGPAAEAAQCAHEQDKFWPYHDLLFENARALTDEDLKKYAQVVELDLESFQSCLASDRPKKAVAADHDAGRRYGVDGTPSIFINGIKLIGLLPLPMMRAVIDSEITR